MLSQESLQYALKLGQWLQEYAWEARFDARALDAGERLVHGVDLKKVLVDPRVTIIEARVDSESLKRTAYPAVLSINMLQSKLIGQCACPRGGWCKHLAAVILALTELAVESAENAESAPEPSAASPEAQQKRLELDNLRDWHEWLKNTQQQKAAEAARRNLVKVGYRLSFVISPHGECLRVKAMVQAVNSAGIAGPAQTLQCLREYGGGSLKVEVAVFGLSEATEDLLRRLFVCKVVKTTERELSGSIGNVILLDLLQDQRCVFEKPGGQLLRLGETRNADLDWIMQPNGTLKLSLIGLTGVSVLVLRSLWYLDIEQGTIGKIEGVEASAYHATLSVPELLPNNAVAITRQLRELHVLEGLKMPVELQETIINGEFSPKMTLVPVNSRKKNQQDWLGILLFDYGLASANSDYAPTLSVVQGSQLTTIQRDTDGERATTLALREMGCIEIGKNIDFWQIPDRFAEHWAASASSYDLHIAADDWLERIEEIRALGIALDIPEAFPLELLQAVPEWVTQISEPSGGRWFDLELGIDIGGETISLLPIIVKALASREFSMQAGANEPSDATWIAKIDDKRRIALPRARVREFCAPILEWLETLSGNSVRLPMLRASVLNEFGASAFAVKSSETMRRLASAMRGERSNEAIAAPLALHAELRDYQREGIHWLDFLAEHGLGGLLADDMGLGKTIQILAHVLHEKQIGRAKLPTLIVMPTSLVPNWQAEAARFAPSLKTLTLHGSQRHSQFMQIPEHDLIFTTYALLFRDESELANYPFELAVFDEAQALKNASAKSAIAARNINARRRIAMTGTPIENHLGELWSQTDLVLPGLFGSRKSFTSNFRSPIEKLADRPAQQRLSARLKPFMLRRTKKEVAHELPAKTEILRRIAIDGPQRQLYETLRLAMHDKVRNAIQARGLASSSIVVLDALLKLRQVCCDPSLVKLGSAAKVRTSAKREYLLEMVTELLEEGRKILVFSQFTAMLDLIEADLRASNIDFERLDGSTVDRATPVKRFQAGEVPMMLISLKAGGVGLNLTAADTVIHYDPWWNPAVENQATDRAHRIGQDKAVFVYKLICTDTVEDKILAMQAQKAKLAEAILSGGSSSALKFDEASLEELFGESVREVVEEEAH
jgi:superfamily II DNA or RNA helicase